MKPEVATHTAARLLHDGSLVMAEMERNGIRVDVGYLKSHTAETEKEIVDLKRKLHSDKLWKRWDRRFGHKANLGSKEQLGKIIFDDLGYTRRQGLAKKDRSRDDHARRLPQNDEAAFQGVDLDFVKDYFRWQKLEKMYGTYLLDMARELVGERVHPFFHTHKVITYRSSSSEPNLHNIPSRNAEITKRVRRCFIPDDGCALVEMDYSGAEVRSACCYTKDPRLIADFTQPGKDPHGDTALLLFLLTKEDITGDAVVEKAWKKGPRDWAKNRMVFPEFFGSTYFQCAPHLWEGATKGTQWDGQQWVGKEAPLLPRLGITVREHLRRKGINKLGDCEPGTDTVEGTFVHRVKQVEEDFWKKRFKVYDAWKKGWWNRYLMNGYFTTLSGFVFNGIYGRNDCLNYGIQGFAFHWLLQSCIYLSRELKRRQMKSKLIVQVHDCVVANVPVRELQDYMTLGVEVMTQWIPRHWPSINVGLDCEVECCPEGTSWAEKSVWQNKAGIWGPKS